MGTIGYMDTMLFDGIASEVAAFFEKNMPDFVNRRFLLALSGGADSAALLHVMAALAQKHGFLLFAAHVNHGLRPLAKEDEVFCQGLCLDHGIPLKVMQIVNLKPGAGVETRGRDARYQALKEAYDAIGADALLTAHHAADQAETVLMHLLRGSGIHGLGGIRPVSHAFGMKLLRPLLGIDKKQLLALGLSHVEDETNAVADNLRNELRINVLPMLERLAPGAGLRLMQTARLAADEDEYMDALAGGHLTHKRLMPLSVLCQMHPAMMRRVLRLFVGGETDYPTIQRLMMLATGAGCGRMNVPGAMVEKGYRYLHLLNPAGEAELSAPKMAVVPWHESKGYGNGKTTQAMTRSLFEQAAFTCRRHGLFIRPFGLGGRQSVQDYLVNRKVDRPFRDKMPMLVSGDEVLWIPGVGAGETARIEAKGDNVFLLADGFMPWNE